jgi:hypothetical protein
MSPKGVGRPLGQQNDGQYDRVHQPGADPMQGKFVHDRDPRFPIFEQLADNTIRRRRERLRGLADSWNQARIGLGVSETRHHGKLTPPKNAVLLTSTARWL